MKEKKERHLLIIGGTGMLSQAVLYFVSKYKTISVIARHQGGLNRLKKQAGERGNILNLLAVDYRNYSKLVKKVEKSVKEFGEIDTIISWIHDTAPDALLSVCRALESKSTIVNLFELQSSEHGKIENYHENRDSEFSAFQKISYHSILLGAIRKDSTTRWLTHTEISQGVIDAVENHRKESIIGENIYEH